MSIFRLSNKKLPFKLKDKIIEGAYGSIYKTNYKNNTVIVKQIKNKYYFDYEFKISKLIKNNMNLCKCISKFETKNYKYLMFPYYSNGDLYYYLSNKKLCESDIKKIIYQMLLTVKNLNSIGYCHCDIKLENFLIDKGENLVLTDFGSIKKIDQKNPDHLFPLDRAIGTASYIPPEFLLYYYGNKSDIWSIGVCFYNILMNDMLYTDVLQYQYYNSVKCFNKLNIDSQILSLQGQYLLKNMLNTNPNKRISVLDAINNKWFDSIRQDYEEIYISEYEVLI